MTDGAGANAVPGWYPDTLGGHEYRYWDGSQWTNQVSDQGVVAEVPIAAPPPVVASLRAGSATPPSGSSPSQNGTRSKKKPWLLALGLIVVVFVVLVAIGALSQDDDEGFTGGSTTGGYSNETVSQLQSACSQGGVTGAGCDCILNRLGDLGVSETEVQQDVEDYLSDGFDDITSIGLAAPYCGETFRFLPTGSSDVTVLG